jgi:hypothetical protein
LQNEKLSSSIYRLLLSLKNNGAQTFKWLNHAESLFNDSGLGYIFDSHDSSDYTSIKLLLNTPFSFLPLFLKETSPVPHTP